jgi:hypothetical protein
MKFKTKRWFKSGPIQILMERLYSAIMCWGVSVEFDHLGRLRPRLFAKRSARCGAPPRWNREA